MCVCVNAGNYVGELGGFPNAYPASLTYYVLIFVKAVFVTPGLGHEAENSNGISSRAGCPSSIRPSSYLSPDAALEP